MVAKFRELTHFKCHAMNISDVLNIMAKGELKINDIKKEFLAVGCDGNL